MLFGAATVAAVRPELERALAVEDGEDLLLLGVAVGAGALSSGGEGDVLEAGGVCPGGLTEQPRGPAMGCGGVGERHDMAGMLGLRGRALGRPRGGFAGERGIPICELDPTGKAPGHANTGE